MSDTSAVVACTSCGAKLRVPVAATGVPRCPRCQTKAPWLVSATDVEFAVSDGAVIARQVGALAPNALAAWVRDAVRGPTSP